MTMEYKRIMDIKESTFDSLEMLCNKESQEGNWVVIQISDGHINRMATLGRYVDEKKLKKETNDKSISTSTTIGTSTAETKRSGRRSINSVSKKED